MLGAFVAVGIAWIFGEIVAMFVIAAAVGFIFLGVGVVLTLVWVVFNPIPTVRGWILFLAGSLTLILLTPLFMYAVVMGGHATLSHRNFLQDVVAFACVFVGLGMWLLIGPLYIYCKDEFKPEDSGSFILIGPVVLAAVLGMAFAKADKSSHPQTCKSQGFAAPNVGFPTNPLQADDNNGGTIMPGDTIGFAASGITDVGAISRAQQMGYSYVLTDDQGLDDTVGIKTDSSISGSFMDTQPSNGSQDRYVNPIAGLPGTELYVQAPQPGSWCVTLTVGSGSQTVYKYTLGLNVDSP
jgi:energy-coupling factor transporter transmembrane protein EcfT